jgi:hypothetical protein
MKVCFSSPFKGSFKSARNSNFRQRQNTCDIEKVIDEGFAFHLLFPIKVHWIGLLPTFL